MTDQPTQLTQSTRAVALSQPRADLPSESEWTIIQRMSRMFAESGLYPHIKNVAQAIAIVQTGRELGVPPSVALREFSVIGGKPAASSAILAALAQRDHGDLALRVTAITDEACTVEFRRRGWPAPTTTTFTMTDAKRAGLLDPQQTRNGVREPNANWAKFPRDMLRSRAISQACRTAFQDSTLGMYTPEELAPESVTVSPEGDLVYQPSAGQADVIEGEQVTHTTHTTETPAGRTVDTVTGEIVEPPADPTPATPAGGAAQSGPMEPLTMPSPLTQRQQLEVRLAQVDTMEGLQAVWKDVCAASTKGKITADERAALVVAKDRRKPVVEFRARIAGTDDPAILSALQDEIDAAASGHTIDEPAAALLTELVTDRGATLLAGEPAHAVSDDAHAEADADAALAGVELS